MTKQLDHKNKAWQIYLLSFIFMGTPSDNAERNYFFIRIASPFLALV